MNTNVTKQGAWGLWWLVAITCGIYYFVWYHRTNRELSALLGRKHEWYGQWWALFIPFVGIVGLWKMAQAVSAAHGAENSPTRVASFTTLVANWWFWSDVRYIQRRMNILHDVRAAKQLTAAHYAQAAALTQGPASA